MEVLVKYLGVVATGNGFLVLWCCAWPSFGEGRCGDVLDECIKASLLPEREAFLNVVLDVCRFDAAMMAAKDAGGECERAFKVPLVLADSTELSGQLGDDSSSDTALQREVEGVGVCDDIVILLLPALVVSNDTVKMVAMIVVDGVTIYLSEEMVDLKWVSRWHGC